MATVAVQRSSAFPAALAEKQPVIVSERLVDSIEPSEVVEPPRYLVVSPYTEQAHLLDLQSVDEENGLLALALVKMRNLREDYATAPYLDTFNWDEVIESLRALARERNHQWKETSFYIVAFRSQIPPTTVYADLGVLDKAAHAEATASGGFLKYWFGDPDVEGRNLATCIWRSREDAIKGGVGPAHRKAAGCTRQLYSNWKIDRHRLVIRDGIESWDIVDWEDKIPA
ncbi:hypothetical protein CONLIGDRAFT_678308 [Coniochaeta ligniaria NRRL 30616]|uniref:Uncharacterized protein n=1 Tax=Coniochaeta ligniaria NRRL 30616 TaxID=1408157 RepID=A0A1J7JEU9_9PEZI|nr:hypothetical protein CONLIGDRAFT_678308 [Coniochaeta ligniaria NRRL 30616]